MIVLLPLLLAAAPVAGDASTERRQINVMATASVTIIRAEPVEVKQPLTVAQQTDRQYWQRASAPMVDFY